MQAVVYEEVVELLPSTSARDGGQEQDEEGSEDPTRSRFVVREMPLTLPERRAPTDKANPKIGIGG